MNASFHSISDAHLTIDVLQAIVSQGKKLVLSDSAVEKINACRNYLNQKITQATAPIYGINTGFGSLYNISIESQDLSQLQKNLILSHACGVGREVPLEIVKYILILKIQSLSYGHSAISLEVVERLVAMYNEDILPVIYHQGSLGASGDLAPLAHLSLPLLGEGEVYVNGEKMHASQMLQKMNWNPITLQSKEGLALLNGTQFMLGYASYLGIEAQKISRLADSIAAISLDAFDGRIEPFDEAIHRVRPHQGQVDTARFFRETMQGSQIIAQPKVHVQDPYSFRCIPQVHGASKDAMQYFLNVIETEINSVTDNPNVFAEEDKIISGGNFHGQPLALALDFLAIALAEWGNISERRTYLLLSGQRGLPTYLVANPGLNSGLMIAQYTAASLVSQNKQYATPASIDSIVSSNGQEDHVSMGANAATKCLEILWNVQNVLSIEALSAAQALDFRRPLKSSERVEHFYKNIREKVSFIETDVIVSDKIRQVNSLLFQA
jgi:histidine ammonia-lyase